MIYVICGPTGSGKTDAAIKVANFLNCPIINADAFQVYKDMNIGTSKIDKKNEGYKKHLLIDIISPEETFSVKEYQSLFREELNKVLKTYNDVVVAGGTGLYIRASLFDYKFDEQPQMDLSKYDNLSNQELFKLLNNLDPNSCETIHMNNRKRVLRAIWVAENMSNLKSENIALQEHKMIYSDVRILMINPDRNKLYDDINNRVDLMFENGLLDEVKNILNKYKLSITSKEAIGYKECIAYLNGEMSLQGCKELIKKRTRNYAKRQITFFKNQFNCEFYNSSEELIKDIINE